MRQIQSEILRNQELAEGFFKLTFTWDPHLRPLPGQFLTIRVSGLPFPLLRRPFAFSHCDGENVSIIVKKRGTATDILSRKSAGETLDVIGPLGNSFGDPDSDRRPVLVAGGIGLGPMLFFATSLHSRGIKSAFIFGSRTAGSIPRCEEFKSLSAVLCTDDGSAGFHGTTVDYLRSLSDLEWKRTELYCCGPLPMLKAASLFAQSKKIPCWVSMEQTMGCSMGACMGCVIKVRYEPGYARVCKEGPIFDSRDVVWT
jgi:dihydroorotate dehydrogenase electron transfer subunit